jgi:hypothetical protein
LADSPLYDDLIDPPTEAKKFTGISPREPHAAGIVAFWFSLTSVALLITAASLIRADRTARVPVVSWGRLAALSATLGGIGSFASGVLSGFGLTKDNRAFGPAALALFLSIGGAVGFLMFLVALYED